MRNRSRILADQVLAPRSRAQLYIVRAEPDERLELPRGEVEQRWVDSVGFGLALTASMLVGAVLIALSMGWLS